MVRPVRARTRIGAIALVMGLSLLASGCTYSSKEPGLFGRDSNPEQFPVSLVGRLSDGLDPATELSAIGRQRIAAGAG